MSNNKEFITQIRDFFNTEAGDYLLSNIQKMRVAHYEKGEKEAEYATIELSRAYGNNEVLMHIKSLITTPKGK